MLREAAHRQRLITACARDVQGPSKAYAPTVLGEKARNQTFMGLILDPK